MSEIFRPVVTETLSAWLRRVFHVEDPKQPGDWVTAYDRDSGEQLGSWEDGGYVPPELFARYLKEVPNALEELRASGEEFPESYQRVKDYL